MSLESEWKGTKIKAEGAYKEFGKPRISKKHVKVVIDKKILLDKDVQFREQWVKKCGERNLHLPGGKLSFNIWITSNGEFKYIVLKTEIETLSTCNTRRRDFNGKLREPCGLCYGSKIIKIPKGIKAIGCFCKKTGYRLCLPVKRFEISITSVNQSKTKNKTSKRLCSRKN